jgi:hypothetical protein
MSGPLELSELELPDGFALRAQLPTVMAHVAREHDFQPNVIVTAQPLSEATSVEAWVEANLAEQHGLLTAARLIDREREDGSPPAERTLIHHVHGPHSVTLEQWWRHTAGRGYVVSASCATLDYDEFAEPFASLARAVDAKLA